ncbi:MAG: alpha/beta hydrolase [Chloroflexi bacterium]|nr:alpha/beta hydrolase [Chloroflexota bacterium]
MHLNTFAADAAPLDMTATDEFESLLASARDLAIAHQPGIRYVSRNVVLRHRRFHFLEWGAAGAPPLLLLHGGHQSAHSWDLVSLHLADRFHVFALDQRGHGDSEWSHDGDYSPGAMADDALAFLEAEGVVAPVVFGHSMGGLVTMTMLKKAPGLPRAVVLVDVGPEVSPEGARVIQAFIRSTAEFDDIEEFVARVQAYDPFRSRVHIERTVRYNMLRRTDGKYVSKCDHFLGDPRRREGEVPRGVSLEDTRAFACPALVVRGAESNILTPEAAERLAAALPRGELVTVPRCGHNVHSQNTPGFIDAVTPFLNAL